MRVKSLINAFFIFAIIGFLSVLYLSICSNLIERAKKELKSIRNGN
jgi:hypothetical protein